ncbi:hypothetical protein AJ88_14195 [Mesorhizobium amorphae CCBAU 01583]|nr:hypothetical protein AJ88_14195 [Mesorhizobium amorphae CCBAU 01583]
MLQRFPETVKWHNNRTQRLLSLTKALIFKTVGTTLATMVAVVVWRGPVGAPETIFGLIFSILFSIVLAYKIIPGLFDIWRMFLWTGRAIFRPRGMQHLQIAVTSLMTFCWISLIVLTALMFAEPAIRFFRSMGLSVSV